MVWQPASASGTPFWRLISDMLCVAFSVISNPFWRRYLAYCSQQPHCGFLYIMTLVSSALATASPRKTASKSVSDRSMLLLPSCNADHAHHSAVLVLQHVAVEHPVTG